MHSTGCMSWKAVAIVCIQTFDFRIVDFTNSTFEQQRLLFPVPDVLLSNDSVVVRSLYISKYVLKDEHK